jgi:hypothetical protein
VKLKVGLFCSNPGKHSDSRTTVTI